MSFSEYLDYRYPKTCRKKGRKKENKRRQKWLICRYANFLASGKLSRFKAAAGVGTWVLGVGATFTPAGRLVDVVKKIKLF